MIAGYRNGQLIAPFTVEGACNRTVFEIWRNLSGAHPPIWGVGDFG